MWPVFIGEVIGEARAGLGRGLCIPKRNRRTQTIDRNVDDALRGDSACAEWLNCLRLNGKASEVACLLELLADLFRGEGRVFAERSPQEAVYGDRIATQAYAQENGAWSCSQFAPMVMCVALAVARSWGMTGASCRVEADRVAALAGCPGILAADVEHPYPGLAFDLGPNARTFFGRRRELSRILSLVCDRRSDRLILVSGRVGAGKSTLLGCQLARLINSGFGDTRPKEQAWSYTYCSLRALDASPLAALVSCSGRDSQQSFNLPLHHSVRRVESVGPSAKMGSEAEPGDSCSREWLIGLDDFELLFTESDGRSRAQFLDVLLGSEHGTPKKVIAAIDSDFLVDCFANETLRRCINSGSLVVISDPFGPELRSMLSEPLNWLSDTSFKLRSEHLDAVAASALGKDASLVHSALVLTDVYRAWVEQGDGAIDEVLPVAGRPDPFLSRTAALERAFGGDLSSVLSRLFARLVRVDARNRVLHRSEPLASWGADVQVNRLIEMLGRDEFGLLHVNSHADRLVSLSCPGLVLVWPALKCWLKKRQDVAHVAETLRQAAVRWASSGFGAQLRLQDEILAPAKTMLVELGLWDELVDDAVVSDFVTPEAEYLLAEIGCSGTAPLRREAIGLRLDELGDVRLGIGTSNGAPRCAWAEVPAGSVIVDGCQELDVSGFFMTVFPVTRIQYQLFVSADDGYSSSAWWYGLQKGEVDTLWLEPPLNYPITRVSWYDAVAYCRWLSARLQFEVRLPDESEWQWAAQSARKDYVYPWGREWSDGCANTDESGIGRATAVGLYPSGQSLQRVYDLAGNTWEWCKNSFVDYGRVSAAASDAKVLKGGSWRVNRGFARADFRLDGNCEDRFSGVSFRLVCSGFGADSRR